jgi:hypothetical protein
MIPDPSSRVPRRRSPSPSGPPSPHPPTGSENPLTPGDLNRLSQSADKVFRTEPNDFGIVREYPHKPDHDPDRVVPLEAVCDAPGLAVNDTPADWFSGMTRSVAQIVPNNPLYPLTSISVFRLLSWFYTYSQMSIAALNDLVQNVICAEDFDRSDPAIAEFSAERELARLDGFASEDGWRTGAVKVEVPITGLKAKDRDPERHTYSIPGVYWRSLTEVIRTFFEETPLDKLHLTPFLMFWTGPSGCESVFSELYNSSAMYNEYVKLRTSLLGKTNMPVVIAAMMLWSDSTHLANFGTASLWPVYLYFGNVSKYIRNKISSFSAYHIAYIPKVRYKS